MDNFVITISRYCGSGGSLIGKLLANELKVNIYDRNLLWLASEESGINESLFANADEKLKSSLLFRVSKKVYNGELIPPDSDDFTSQENLFNYQAKVLKELAKNESYVVIGRCANFILKNHPRLINVFLYADHDICVKRQIDKLHISQKDAEILIAQKNRNRKEYYKYFTGRDWDDMTNYDICLNTGILDDEGCIKQIKSYMKLKFGEDIDI